MVLDLDDLDGLKEPKEYTHGILAEMISAFHEGPFGGKAPDGSNFVAIQFTKDLNKVCEYSPKIG